VQPELSLLLRPSCSGKLRHVGWQMVIEPCVASYQTAPCNISEGPRTQLRRGGNLKSCSLSCPLVRILSQISPVHVLPLCSCNIHFNIILPSVYRSSKWSPSFRFPHQSPVFLFVSYAIRTTYSVRLILMKLLIM
jgi:hypothetical protein